MYLELATKAIEKCQEAIANGGASMELKELRLAGGSSTDPEGLPRHAPGDKGGYMVHQASTWNMDVQTACEQFLAEAQGPIQKIIRKSKDDALLKEARAALKLLNNEFDRLVEIGVIQ
jgi:hypothetical protein